MGSKLLTCTKCGHPFKVLKENIEELLVSKQYQPIEISCPLCEHIIKTNLFDVWEFEIEDEKEFANFTLPSMEDLTNSHFKKKAEIIHYPSQPEPPRSVLEEFESEPQYEESKVYKEKRKKHKIKFKNLLLTLFRIGILIVISTFIIKSGILNFSNRWLNGGAGLITLFILVILRSPTRRFLHFQWNAKRKIIAQLLLYVIYQGIVLVVYYLILLIKG